MDYIKETWFSRSFKQMKNDDGKHMCYDEFNDTYETFNGENDALQFLDLKYEG